MYTIRDQRVNGQYQCTLYTILVISFLNKSLSYIWRGAIKFPNSLGNSFSFVQLYTSSICSDLNWQRLFGSFFNFGQSLKSKRISLSNSPIEESTFTKLEHALNDTISRFCAPPKLGVSLRRLEKLKSRDLRHRKYCLNQSNKEEARDKEKEKIELEVLILLALVV